MHVRPRLVLPALAGLVVAVACCDGSERRPSGAPPLGAPEPSLEGSDVDAGPCEHGDVRSCKVQIDADDCFEGEQLCHAGQWSSCREAGSFGGFQTTSQSSSSGCIGNSCNPDCNAFEEEPAGGIAFGTPGGGGGGSISGGDPTMLPGGFQNKLFKDVSHPPSFASCSTSGSCQADHYCDDASGECVPWGDGDYDATKGDPNYTLRTPCDGQPVVCNRGGATAPAGAKVLVISGNSSKMQKDLGSCTGFSGSVAGSCTTAGVLQPGECALVSGCEAFLSGTKTLYINSTDHAPPHHDETDCADNWAAYHSNAAGACSSGASSVTTEEIHTYAPSCPDGQRAKWDWLSYDASVPSGTTLEIHAQRAADLASLPPDCGDCVLLANIPSVDPALCAMGGPSPCPLNLTSALGIVTSSDDVLQLVFRGTNDGTSQPVLNDWEVRFTCEDAL
jgi:hypothetical protein